MEHRLKSYINALKYGTGSGWKPSQEEIVELLEEIYKNGFPEDDGFEENSELKNELERMRDNAESIKNDLETIEDKSEEIQGAIFDLSFLINDLDYLID